MEPLLLTSGLSPSPLSTGERIWSGQADFKNKLNACPLTLSISGSYGQVGGNSTLTNRKKCAHLLPCASYDLSSLEQRPSHCRNSKSHLDLASAASQHSLEFEPEAYNSNCKLNSVKDSLSVLYNFVRPLASFSMVVTATSVSLLSVERLSDLNSKFFTGLLQAIIPLLLMHIFVVGVNQLADIDIDKVNKPYLPLASRKLSFGAAVMIVVSALIMSVCIGIIIGSRPLIWFIFSAFVHGTGYSINLPLLRWKNSAVAAAISITAYLGMAIPVSCFLHMQTHVLGKPAHFPRPLLFVVAFMTLLSTVIALLKDIPDIDGDKKFGVKSLVSHLGQKRVFWICISILLMDYVGGILVGSLCSTIWSKVITILGHLVLATIMLARAKSIDLNNKPAMETFVNFIWLLQNAEYLLVPFIK